MKIKIMTDSTCDLPKDLLDTYGIAITPLTVIKNDEAFKDGITIKPADIFAHVAAGGDLCSTSAVSVGDYMDFFAAYAKDYDGIVHVSLGSGFSASYQNACLDAEEFENVRVVDSKNLTVGQGVVAMKAAELSKTADTLDALVEELNAFADNVEASFVVDKLDYLVKGGRCSSAAALGANLLNLKPCIEVKDNKMTVVKKYRGSFAKCLSSYVKDRLEGRADIDQRAMFLVQTTVPEEAHAATMEAVAAYGNFDTVHQAVAGCTISCHCGPGTLGIIFMRK